MNGRILLYTFLALTWAALAVSIFLGAHERWLGRADDWKQYLAMGLCGLMCLWNVARIFMLRQMQRVKTESHDLPA